MPAGGLRTGTKGSGDGGVKARVLVRSGVTIRMLPRPIRRRGDAAVTVTLAA